MDEVNLNKLFDDIAKKLRENKVGYGKWLEYYGAYLDAVKLDIKEIDYYKIGSALLNSSILYLYDSQEEEHKSKKAELAIFLARLRFQNEFSVAEVYASCFPNQEEKGKK